MLHPARSPQPRRRSSSRARLDEGKRGDGGTTAGKLNDRAGRDEVAFDVGERDRVTERRRCGRTRDFANLFAVSVNDSSDSRHVLSRGEHEAHQLLSDPTVAAMKNPDDDFLPDVAPLGKADGLLFDSRFQRNRLVVHVGPEERYARFDAKHVGCLIVDVGGTSGV